MKVCFVHDVEGKLEAIEIWNLKEDLPKSRKDKEVTVMAKL